MNRNAVVTLALVPFLAAGPAHAAAAQAAFNALFDGVVFFGGMIVLAIIAAALRIRDARSGLTDDEKKARLKRRLPRVMGAFFGLVFYILLRSI